MAIGIANEDSKQVGDDAPTETILPGISFRIRFEVTEVAEGGDISFGWEVLEATLTPPDGTPEAIRDGMQQLAGAFAGRRGTGVQTARGLNRELLHAEPIPEAPEMRPLFALLGEILTQNSTPLPEEPVGIGARWEVTDAKYHVEGMRITQTVTYELESRDESEVRLRMYVALIGPNQEFALPASGNARLKSAHGDGAGELVVDLDRPGERSFWMSVTSRAVLTVTDAGGTEDVSTERTMRYEAARE